MSPTQKSLLACTLFSLFGVIGWFYDGTMGGILLPLVLYYVVLVTNTFFSVRTFSAITPNNPIQLTFDVLLVFVYLWLAASFASVVMFSWASLGLFLIAVAKYVHLSGIIPPPPLLQKKIRINALSALLCASALVASALGFDYIAAWGLFLLFALANIYLLLINPMYRTNERPDARSSE